MHQQFNKNYYNLKFKNNMLNIGKMNKQLHIGIQMGYYNSNNMKNTQNNLSWIQEIFLGQIIRPFVQIVRMKSHMSCLKKWKKKLVGDVLLSYQQSVVIPIICVLETDQTLGAAKVNSIAQTIVNYMQRKGEVFYVRLIIVDLEQR